MTKRELAREIADRLGGSCQHSIDFLDVFMEEVTAFFERGGEAITLRGFGTIGLSRRKAYDAKCPRTGAPTHIKATKTLIFKPSADLRSRLN
jgi:nucleoid DNA-binding protein